MMRIKLPGNNKTKRILLMVLLLVSIVVLISQGIENKKALSKQKEIQVQIDKEERESQEKVIQKQKELDDKLVEKVQEAKEEFFSKNYTKAIELSTEVIKENPQMYEAYNIRGITKAYSGSFDEGMQDIDKSLEINPKFGYARFNKALNYELYERFEEALEWYNKALEVEDYVWSYYGIASIYGRKGEVDNTVTYLRKAIDIDKAVINVAKEEHDFDPVKKSKEFVELIYK